MGDNVYLGDRDGVRTPMQWTGDRNGGFSRADFAQLYLPPLMDPVYGYQAVNVEAQLRTPYSLLRWLRRFIELRKQHPGLRARHATRRSRPTNPTRSSRTSAATRTTSSSASTTSPARRRRSSWTSRWYEGMVPEEMFGRTRVPAHRRAAVPAHARARAGSSGSSCTRPEDAMIAERDPGGRARRSSRRTRCSSSSSSRRWFGSKAEEVRARERRSTRRSLRERAAAARRRARRDPLPDRDARPLPAPARLPAGRRRLGRRDVIARERRLASSTTRSPTRRSRASSSSSCARGATVARRRRARSSSGAVDRAALGGELGEPRLVGVEQSNTSVVFGDELILKAYRRLEAGLNPELELLRFLTERELRQHRRRSPAGTPTRAGCIEATLGILQEFVPDASRRLGARARRARARPGGLPRAAAAARRGDRRDAHGARLRLDRPRLRARGAERRGARAARRRRSTRRSSGSSSTCPRREALAPIAGRGEEVRERLQLISHVGAVGPRDPAPRRLPPRPGALERAATGSCSTSRASRRARCPSGGASARRCATSPGCCARSPTPPPRREFARRRRRPRAGRSARASEFLAGYFATVDRTLVPPERGRRDRLLAVFELEKAVYELRYELNNRPDWVRIPVAGIAAAAGAAALSSSCACDARTTRTPCSARTRRTAASSSARTGPTATSVARPARGRRAGRARAGRPSRPVRGRRRGRDAAAPLRARGQLPGRQHVHAARPVRVPADARRARPPPRRRGPPRAALRAARRARARGRRRRRHELRRLGAERALGRASSATSTAGTGGCNPMRSLGAVGHLGAVRPGRRATGRATSSSSAAQDGELRLKADPLAFATEAPPRTASIVHRSTHEWDDDDVARARGAARAARRADVDLRGAPRLVAAEPARGQPARCRYRELADELADYARRPGLHARRAAAGDGAPVLRLVGLPGDGLLRAALRASARPTTSAPSSTRCTRRGIGVILDWVPAHFPRDDWALARFDGTALYEHDDPRRGAHPDWGTLVFNLGAQRGAELPARERALLAARVPRRRAARRRRRLDALPRLLARGGRVGAERSSAATRTSTPSRS